jgi:hypothetical protein
MRNTVTIVLALLRTVLYFIPVILFLAMPHHHAASAEVRVSALMKWRD